MRIMDSWLSRTGVKGCFASLSRRTRKDGCSGGRQHCPPLPRAGEGLGVRVLRTDKADKRLEAPDLRSQRAVVGLRDRLAPYVAQVDVQRACDNLQVGPADDVIAPEQRQGVVA